MTRMTGPDCVVMCNLINTHTHTHPLSRLIRGFRNKYHLIPPWEDQCEWHRMTRMTRPDCAVICNLINTHTHTHTSLIPPREDQCEWHRMTRMTGPDCVVMCNLINTHTHTHTHGSLDHGHDVCGSQAAGNWAEGRSVPPYVFRRSSESLRHR